MSDAKGLRPCPFCGAGETQIRPQMRWTGMRNILDRVEIHHWCEPKSTQLRSHLTIVGKTMEEAISSWEASDE